MAKNNITIVIDPGHGGGNEGALWENYVEKEITLKVAKAMKDELDKYEGITAYLTRDEDEELSLKERVEIANDYDADFIFCLHFNMSAEHTLYGAECWVSAFDSCYSRAYDFSKIEMEALTGIGLFDRGIKTRINKKDQDYYGIIRNAKEYNIPSVIIEHCHLDHENDSEFVNEDTWLEAYGRLDATAVAKYYGLKSKVLGVDYSGYTYEKTAVPDKPVYPDSTPPEYCNVNLFEIDEYTGEAKVELCSHDEDSRLMYYTYSLDGGESFATFRPWPKDSDTAGFTIQIPENQTCNIIFSVDNLYNLSCKSEEIIVDAFEYTKVEEPVIEEILVEEIPSFTVTEITEAPSTKPIGSYAFLSCEIAVILALMAFTISFIPKLNRRKRKMK